MFIIETSKEYDWPVVVKFPNNGAYDEKKFTVKFKKLNQDEFAALFNGGDDMTDKKIASIVVLGWGQDEVGAEFNQDNLNRMLETVGFGTAIVQAYVQSIEGILRKN